MTLNRNRKCIGIALILVVFGKIIDLIEQFTGKTSYTLIGESVNVETLQQAFEGALAIRKHTEVPVFSYSEEGTRVKTIYCWYS